MGGKGRINPEPDKEERAGKWHFEDPSTNQTLEYDKPRGLVGEYFVPDDEPAKEERECNRCTETDRMGTGYGPCDECPKNPEPAKSESETATGFPIETEPVGFPLPTEPAKEERKDNEFSSDPTKIMVPLTQALWDGKPAHDVIRDLERRLVEAIGWQDVARDSGERNKELEKEVAGLKERIVNDRELLLLIAINDRKEIEEERDTLARQNVQYREALELEHNLRLGKDLHHVLCKTCYILSLHKTDAVKRVQALERVVEEAKEPMLYMSNLGDCGSTTCIHPKCRNVALANVFLNALSDLAKTPPDPHKIDCTPEGK